MLEELFTAYYDARRNKRNTLNALAFELNYETKLFQLAEEIEKREYEISKSICFINYEPVQREIFAADFRDRIVHHLVFNYINPIFDKVFINDSYSCRKGRGTHYGIKRVRKFISQCSVNYNKDCYIMKLDIEGYFMKMDKEILYQKIMKVLIEKRKTIQDSFELIVYLLQKIIFNDPTKNCYIKGKKSDWAGLPMTKSLFCSDEGKGLPIGNLTSQLFGNIYLNDFDHYVKNELQIKYYARYVDDIILVHENKYYLIDCRDKIKKYLKYNEMLILHPKKFYFQHYSKGVAFLGVFIKPYRIYIGSRTKKNFYNKIKFWNNKIECKNGLLTKVESKEFMANINSYLGLLKHYNTYSLSEKIMLNYLDRKLFGLIESTQKR